MEVNPSEYHTKLVCNRSNIFDKDSWLSKSVLNEFVTGSPYRWRFYPKEFKPTAAMNHGTIVDILVTTPHELEDSIAIHDFESFRTKEAKQFKAEAEAVGKIVLRESELDYYKQAADMILTRNSDSSGILKGAKTQYMLKMTANEFAAAGVDDIKVNLKGLVDVVPDGDYLCDIKTTNDNAFSYKGFEKTIANLNYHMQAGLYLALWNLTHPDDQRDRWLFIWQNSSPPFEVAVTELALVDINAGKDLAMSTIKRLQQCAETGYWPMKYEGERKVISRPMWAFEQEDED